MLFTFLSLSLFPRVVDAKTKCSTLTKAHKVSRFFYLLCRVWGTNATWHQRKEKEHDESREIRESFAQRLSQETQEKRQRKVQRKKQNKKFLSSLFLSSRALQSFVVPIAFGRYESYLINLFLLQEESFHFHDERRREKGKFRVYYISSRRRRIVVSSFSSGEF